MGRGVGLLVGYGVCSISHGVSGKHLEEIEREQLEGSKIDHLPKLFRPLGESFGDLR